MKTKNKTSDYKESGAMQIATRMLFWPKRTIRATDFGVMPATGQMVQSLQMEKMWKS